MDADPHGAPAPSAPTSGWDFDGDPAVIASPEWFGDGKQSFRQILWRRDLAQLLLNAGPRDFKIQEVP